MDQGKKINLKQPKKAKREKSKQNGKIRANRM